VTDRLPGNRAIELPKSNDLQPIRSAWQDSVPYEVVNALSSSELYLFPRTYLKRELPICSVRPTTVCAISRSVKTLAQYSTLCSSIVSAARPARTVRGSRWATRPTACGPFDPELLSVCLIWKRPAVLSSPVALPPGDRRLARCWCWGSQWSLVSGPLRVTVFSATSLVPPLLRNSASTGVSHSDQPTFKCAIARPQYKVETGDPKTLDPAVRVRDRAGISCRLMKSCWPSQSAVHRTCN
jgi:hypothetical protein